MNINRFGNATDQGQRKSQQDALGWSNFKDADLVARTGILGVVADGVGGAALGAEASQAALQTLLEVHAEGRGKDIPILLWEGLNAANRAVLALRAQSNGENVGTTLAAALIHQGFLYWISVGDSRIYLARGRELIQVTEDQANENQLLSCLGMDTLGAVDRNIRPLPLKPGDRILLVTDGVYKALSDAEMMEIVASSPEALGANAIAEHLRERALNKGLANQDNLSALVCIPDLGGASVAKKVDPILAKAGALSEPTRMPGLPGSPQTPARPQMAPKPVPAVPAPSSQSVLGGTQFELNQLQPTRVDPRALSNPVRPDTLPERMAEPNPAKSSWRSLPVMILGGVLLLTAGGLGSLAYMKSKDASEKSQLAKILQEKQAEADEAAKRQKETGDKLATMNQKEQSEQIKAQARIAAEKDAKKKDELKRAEKARQEKAQAEKDALIKKAEDEERLRKKAEQEGQRLQEELNKRIQEDAAKAKAAKEQEARDKVQQEAEAKQKADEAAKAKEKDITDKIKNLAANDKPYQRAKTVYEEAKTKAYNLRSEANKAENAFKSLREQADKDLMDQKLAEAKLKAQTTWIETLRKAKDAEGKLPALKEAMDKALKQIRDKVAPEAPSAKSASQGPLPGGHP